jgi:DNA repair and recombination protein RAD54B
LVKGSLEERIWQRQVVKRGLADSILEGGGSGNGNGGSKVGVAQFSRGELRDLFRLDESEDLRTHELLGCPCGGLGNSAGSADTKQDDGERPYFVEDSAGSDNEEDELLDMPELIKASRLSNAAMEEQGQKHPSRTHDLQINAKRQKEQDMQQPLMLYSHINAGRLSQLQEESEESEELERIDDIIDDDCLMAVLREGQLGAGRVAYVFKKTSKSKAEENEN